MTELDMKTRMMLPVLVVFAACNLSADFSSERIFRPSRDFRTDENIRRLYDFDDASWYGFPAGGTYRFRCDFKAVGGEDLIVDVSADNRYILKLDGREIGRGPHRGFLEYWQFSSYRIAGLEPGDHRIEATVWHLESSPLAQIMSKRGAFALRASGSFHRQLTTGCGRWEMAPLVSVVCDNLPSTAGTFGVGGRYLATGTSAEFENPPDSKFKPAKDIVKRPVHAGNNWGVHSSFEYYASPSVLPEMLHKPIAPGRVKAARSEYMKDETVYEKGDAAHPFVVQANRLLEGASVTIPPETKVRFVWDLGDYYCAYPYLKLSGGNGAQLRWGWTEALFDAKKRKQRRDAFENLAASRLFADRFVSDGRKNAEFSTCWWRCGKWCQIEIKTGGEPLTIEKLMIFETRYPMRRESSFACDDASIGPVLKICARAMEMCTHEMFFDCPYYEQQMYGGDSRTQFLTVSSMTSDDRHIRHALRLFDESRRSNGLIGMNTPTRGKQDSVTYSMIYPLMLADYMKWHDNRGFLAARLGGMRQLLSTLELFEDESGALGILPGWSFVDWRGASLARDNHVYSQAPRFAAADFLYLMALRSAAEIESAFGNHALASHWMGKAQKLISALKKHYWDDGRKMFADDAKHSAYSEHVQCLAILGGAVTGRDAEELYAKLISDPDLLRTTVYFSYYLFETHARFGRTDLILKALDLWKSYVEIGAATTLEQPVPSRSDCHAWGSHPLHHMHASVLGVRPAAPFFSKVKIAPKPGPLKFIKAVTPHPKGVIKSDLRFDRGKISGCITLPEGVEGELEWGGRTLPIASGKMF